MLLINTLYNNNVVNEISFTDLVYHKGSLDNLEYVQALTVKKTCLKFTNVSKILFKGYITHNANLWSRKANGKQFSNVL